jgi:hypothetical protein
VPRRFTKARSRCHWLISQLKAKGGTFAALANSSFVRQALSRRGLWRMFASLVDAGQAERRDSAASAENDAQTESVFAKLWLESAQYEQKTEQIQRAEIIAILRLAKECS